ncbi:riboflavin synthase subunit beta [Marinomonas sp. MED121]|uniref:hypothetical protein n=1 Tax=Marinomonas sp. MED121 TaxID=314277 RepID=UPI000069057B|nr:hypothetical protein [Marinomonas sp. MED121]EAQ63665.1 riboflavin synthase subunit beta [Marinomonas sp. MED121]
MFVKAERLSHLSLFKLLLTALSSSLFVLLLLIAILISVVTYLSDNSFLGKPYHFLDIFTLFIVSWPLLSLFLTSLLWLLSASGLWLFSQVFSIKLEFEDVIETSLKQ